MNIQIKLKETLEIAVKLTKLGKIPEAIEQYSLALELQPNCTDALVALANLHEKNQELDQAINYQKQVVKLMPKNSNAKVKLGSLMLAVGKAQEAIDYYQQIIALNSEQPGGIYNQLGSALNKLGKVKESIAVYQKALNIYNKNLAVFRQQLREKEDSKLLRNFETKGDLLQKQENSSEAIASSKQALDISSNINIEKQIHPELISVYTKQEKQEEAELIYQKSIISGYLVNHNHKIVYCPIPKNACTLFKTLMVEHSDDRQKYQESSQGIHTFVRRDDVGVKLTDPSYMYNPDYFKFVIFRNPFKRLVSAYLNLIGKRARPVSFACKLVKDVYTDLGMKPDIYKSITFSQFINYLVKTEDDLLNPHWRPQHTFLHLEEFQFDYIGQFEKLDEVTKYINKKLAVKIDENWSRYKRTKYTNYQLENKLHRKYPKDLIRLIRKLGGFPITEQFYTPELEAMVREKYAEDIKIYEREFKQVVEF